MSTPTPREAIENNFSRGGGPGTGAPAPSGSGPLSRRYWCEALWNEMLAVWGKHRLYKETAHLTDLCYYAAIASFMAEGAEEIETRRRLLFYYLSGPFANTDPHDVLQLHYHKLPVDSFVPKILANLCTAYQQPPERVWMTANATVADSTSRDYTAKLRALYAQGNAALQLQQAHEWAELLGACLVRPIIDADGKLCFRLVTPEYFRAETSDDTDSDEITKLTIATAAIVDGKQETRFDVWTADQFWQEDYEGNRVKSVDKITGETAIEFDNPYGKIPYILLRMSEPKDRRLLPGGMFATMEQNLACNMLRFSSDNGGTYEAWGQWLAVNLNMETRKDKRLGFGRMIAVDKVEEGNGALLPPDLRHVKAEGQYAEVDKMRRERQRTHLRDRGLPDSIASDNPGLPLSGVSRVYERSELLETRRRAILALRAFECDLAYMVIVVINESASRVRRPLLPPDLKFSIDFADEPAIVGEQERFTLNTQKLLAGTMKPSQYAAVEMGLDATITDEDAVAEITRNLELVAPLRAAMEEAIKQKAADQTTTGAAANA